MRGSVPVHPHGRGEHTHAENQKSPNYGSSPRSWGTLDSGFSLRRRCRFIPTVVGNTQSAQPQLLSRTVHPHGRGEHFISEPGSLLKAGSSPRSWGTLTMHITLACGARFIPTVVGNTRTETGSRVFKAVHPHGRGEHGQIIPQCIGQPGSSPRSWGTHLG
ncbi:hypothetical protein MPL1_10067 [Methylophaga lonarensis MPL]|uniref:Uncharacterized protein n=1 Tax=Methylophaga lonarensis MPL TaxID=1286106 RepID=M7PPY1_9GAMM|nr:hypothetical protein MPL1_10067 [Methylophaga lonarensis MPL]